MSIESPHHFFTTSGFVIPLQYALFYSAKIGKLKVGKLKVKNMLHK